MWKVSWIFEYFEPKTPWRAPGFEANLTQRPNCIITTSRSVTWCTLAQKAFFTSFSHLTSGYKITALWSLLATPKYYKKYKFPLTSDACAKFCGFSSTFSSSKMWFIAEKKNCFRYNRPSHHSDLIISTKTTGSSHFQCQGPNESYKWVGSSSLTLCLTVQVHYWRS